MFVYMFDRTKSDEEKYGNILQRLSTLLNLPTPDDSSPTAAASHVQAQVFIVAIFQPLCDIDVTMVTSKWSSDREFTVFRCQYRGKF